MRKEKVFVVRLWSDSVQNDVWRASIENIISKERLNFASVEKLSDYLKFVQGVNKQIIDK